MHEIVKHPLGKDFSNCTGCAACAAVCPSASIVMRADSDGFLYPQISPCTCDNCGLCRTICPVNPDKVFETQSSGQDSKKTPAVFASWHLNDAIRRESSSGGVFTALAEAILAKGGVIAGAAIDDNFVVRHILIDNSADLERLRGTKYVQSEIAPALYRQIFVLLSKRDRPVLYSGTPCQVAGLRSFLGKHYPNLFCCDIICHGVPSPKFFDAYKAMLESRYGAKARRIVFRRKDCGWKRFFVSVSFDNGTEYHRVYCKDPINLGFDISLRSSCYICKYTRVYRTGDLTIADFWGVQKKYPGYDQEDKGTSLVLVNTVQGQIWLDSVRTKIFLGPADLETAVAGQLNLVSPTTRPPERNTFFNDLRILPFDVIIRKYRLRPPNIIKRAFLKFKKVILGFIYKLFLLRIFAILVHNQNAS